ncbi:MAG: 3-dehydroquinate synthase, partial [Bacteroidales bacterium]|nr:3-dehydroquinate synthase [Bacteroidales bacterium]
MHCNVAAEDIRIINCPLEEVGRWLPDAPVFIICDSNVKGLAGRLGITPEGVFVLEASEAGKTFATVLAINRWLMEQGADRDAFVLGIGGGITTDIAGFAASVYKRGVRFAFLPTTLLSQVDAAIGGKNGVNLDSFKNMMGVIRQP